MIKRATTLIIILLANTILLVFAAIPHHHHNNEVCIISSHCQTDSEAHAHGTTQHNHEHDGNNDNQYCVLKQAVILPSNHNKQEYKCFHCLDNHPDFIGFHSVLIDSGSIIHITPILTYEQTLIPSFYSRFVSTGLSLRAPPIV